MDKDLQQDLESPINNENIVSGEDNLAVKSAQKLMDRAERIRVQKEQEWKAIQDLFELGFQISNPEGTRLIESQLLHQAIYRVVSKMKPLDVSMHATGASEDLKKIAVDGVATVLNEGGFTDVLRNGFGTFYRMLLFGDAFVRIGTDKKNVDFPIKFQNNSLLNVYVDPFAINLRSPSGQGDCNELVAIYKYSWDEAIALYPKLAEEGTSGRIKRMSTDTVRDLERTNQQSVELEDREVEIAHYYNITGDSLSYTVFGGSTNTVLDEYEGDEYPFMKDGEPFIPFLHFMTFPGSEGFYNFGIGHVLYKLAIVTRQLNNRAIHYGMDNVDPIRMVNIPQGKRAEFFNKMLAAQEAQASGRKGFVDMEYSPADPARGQVNVESFRSDPLTQEWERLFMKLEQDIKRMGISLDDIDRGRSTTATQIIAEEENADLFVKQILEQNAGEFRFTWELTIEMIKKFVKKTNKRVLNMTSTVVLPDSSQQVQIEGITMGMLSDELKKKDYFVKVNARSGSVPSNVLQQAQLSRIFSVLPPGSPAFNKMAVKMARLNDQDLSLDDLAGAGGGGGGGTPEGGIPSETDALKAGNETEPAI